MRNVKYHLLGLSIYSIWAVGLDWIFGGEKFRLPIELLVLLEEFWIFYTGYLTLVLTFRSQGSRKLMALPVLLISIAGAYAFTLGYYFLRQHYWGTPAYSVTDIHHQALQAYTRFFIYSIGLFFFTSYVSKQKRLRQVEQEQYQLKENLLRTENNFLRAQINPHFLYNSLNHLYAETFEQSPQAAEAIMRLSQVMRYSIQDFSKDGGMASLQEEVEHIQNVIAINSFRFAHSLHLNFNVEGSIKDKQVLPLLLITLVENMFKHGNLQDTAQPGIIQLQICEQTQTIQLCTVNKLGARPVETSSGVGLQNIRLRLREAYGDAAVLEVIKGPDVFEAKLIVPYFSQTKTKPLLYDEMYDRR